MELHYRFLIVLGLVALILGALSLLRSDTAQEGQAVEKVGAGAPAQAKVQRLGPPAPAIDRAGWEADFARMYAQRGQERDAAFSLREFSAGEPAPAAGESPDIGTQALADSLLSQQPVQNWRQLGAGVAAIVPEPVTQASPVVSAAASTLPPGHVLPADPKPGAPPRPGAVVQTERVLALHESDLYSDMLYDASLYQGQDYQLENASPGDYVVHFATEDPGTLRVNDGLVIPGRWYLIDGTMSVRSEQNVRLTVRPADQVTGFHVGSAAVPAADG